MTSIHPSSRLVCILGCGKEFEPSTISDIKEYTGWHVRMFHEDLLFTSFAVELLTVWLSACTSKVCGDRRRCRKQGLVCSFPDCKIVSGSNCEFVVHLLMTHNVDIQSVIRIPTINVHQTEPMPTLARWNADSISHSSTGQRLTATRCVDGSQSLLSLFKGATGPLLNCKGTAVSTLRSVAKQLSCSFIVEDCSISDLTARSAGACCDIVAQIRTSFICGYGNCSSHRHVMFIAQCNHATGPHECFADSSTIRVLGAHAVICRAHTRSTDSHQVCSMEALNIMADAAAPFLTYLNPGDRMDDVHLVVLQSAQEKATQAVAHLQQCGHPIDTPGVQSCAPADKVAVAVHRHWRARSAVSADIDRGVPSLIRALRTGLLSDHVRFAGQIVWRQSPSWLVAADHPSADYCLLVPSVGFDIFKNANDSVKASWLRTLSVDSAALVTEENLSALTLRAAAPHGLDVMGAGEIVEGSGWDLPFVTSLASSRKYITLLIAYFPSESEQCCLAVLRLLSLVCGFAPVGLRHPAARSWHRDVEERLLPKVFTPWQRLPPQSQFQYDTFCRQFSFIASDAQPSFVNAVATLRQEFGILDVPRTILDPLHLSNNLKRALFESILQVSTPPSTREANRKALNSVPWAEFGNEVFISLCISASQKALRRIAHTIETACSGVSLNMVLQGARRWVMQRTRHLGDQQSILDMLIMSDSSDAVALAEKVDCLTEEGSFMEGKALLGLRQGQQVHPQLQEMFASLRYLEIGESAGVNPFVVGNTRSNEALHRTLRSQSAGVSVRTLTQQVRHDSNSIILKEEQGTVPELLRRWKLLVDLPSPQTLRTLATAPSISREDALLLVAAWHAFSFSGTLIHLYKCRSAMSDIMSKLRTTHARPLQQQDVLSALQQGVRDHVIAGCVPDIIAISAPIIRQATESTERCRGWSQPLHEVSVAVPEIQSTGHLSSICPLKTWYEQRPQSLCTMSLGRVVQHNVQCSCERCIQFRTMVLTIAPVLQDALRITHSTSGTVLPTSAEQDCTIQLRMRPAKRRRKQTKHAKSFSTAGTSQRN